MLLNDGDDNWNSTAILCVYEKQPLIGAVHELIVDFRDDILTIFPKIIFLNITKYHGTLQDIT